MCVNMFLIKTINLRLNERAKFTTELFNENLPPKVLSLLACMHNVRDFNYMCMLCPYLQRISIYTADISLLKVGKRSGHQMLLDLPLPVTKPEVLCWWNCWVTASLCWVMIGCVAVVKRNCVQSKKNKKISLIYLMSIYFHHYCHHFIQIA